MTEEISGVIFGVWFLIGAALVFWMQAGFAMVEAGFTRAKNTGNRSFQKNGISGGRCPDQLGEEKRTGRERRD